MRYKILPSTIMIHDSRKEERLESGVTLGESEVFKVTDAQLTDSDMISFVHLITVLRAFDIPSPKDALFLNVIRVMK